MTKQALSHLELGTREPTWETVQRVALALGLDCRSFTDPTITLPAEPAEGEKPKRGRPRKVEAVQPPADPKKKPRGKKA